MRTPKPLPCRLHPKDAVTTRKLLGDAQFVHKWVVSCRDPFCGQLGKSKPEAVTKWNMAQKEEP